MKRSERAVVLGASMSGLFAARVLTDFYSSVTVVDRDVLPQEPRNRRGVPQGAHIHVMQARGSHAVEELFPGLWSVVLAFSATIAVLLIVVPAVPAFTIAAIVSVAVELALMSPIVQVPVE